MQRRHVLNLALIGMLPVKLLAQEQKVTGLVLDEVFARHHINPHHPESPERYFAIEQRLQQQDHFLNRLLAIKIKSSTYAEPWLTRIHSPEHVAAIKVQDSVTYENALFASSACLSAVDAVMEGKVKNAFCASRPPGHHARNTEQEEGFCYFNHIAVAARYAQDKYGLQRILIVDWDYHHGNGTEWAFYEDDSVLFFSTHDQFAYPGTGDPSRMGAGKGDGLNINIHLDCGSTDNDILEVFNQRLTPAVADFKPELILISAGFDSRQDDLLGCFNISDEGFYWLTRFVVNLADKYCDGRVVSLLEGGYNTAGTAQAVLSHLKALSA